MKTKQSFVQFENGRPIFDKAYCDFNGNSSIVNRKRKYNKKYLVYSASSGEKVVMPEMETMTILNIFEYEEEKIVFYVDHLNRVSFIRTKQNNLPLETILDKVEKTPSLRNVVFSFYMFFIFFGVMRFRHYDFLESYFSLGYDKTLNYRIRFIFPKRIREKFAFSTNRFSLFVHAYFVFIPIKHIYEHYLKTSDINTPVFIRLKHEDISYVYQMKANGSDKYNIKHYIYNTKSLRLRRDNVELFVRKSISGQYVIVLTSILNKGILLKEAFAYWASFFRQEREIYDVYFEKFSAGAGESAFELFKYAYSMNDDSVYILDKNHPDFKDLKKLFGKSLVSKNSFSAFYHIFLAKSFLSSDLVSHLQRRLYDNDSLMKEKILSIDKKIFLQHGVCLATNVFERGYFNRKVPIAPDYIVTNSYFESSLFAKHTDYDMNHLIPTGLPNLDLYVNERKNKKEEISFMLTWRPWDLTGSIEKGSYLDRYLSFLELTEKNPFYKDKKINIILHPKARLILQEQFPKIFSKYEEKFYTGDIKEALLSSKALITDYSSVAFFAFAGGSNVMFYWQDKEKAETEYGAANILQKENVFGDVIENMDKLHDEIVKNYNREQTFFYQNRFSNLVEYTNGENTKNTYQYIQKYISPQKERQFSVNGSHAIEKANALN